MLTQKDQRTIRSQLDNIYRILLSKEDIDYFNYSKIENEKPTVLAACTSPRIKGFR